MEKDLDLKLMDDIMGSFVQSDEWAQIVSKATKQEDEEFYRLLAKVKKNMGANMAYKLEWAVLSCIAAAIDCAILYGIHVAETMLQTAANPLEYFKYLEEEKKNKQPPTLSKGESQDF